MPAVGFGCAADVEVSELMKQGLEDVAGADAGVGGDRESVLGRDGEAEAVRPDAGAAYLQLWRARRERAAGKDWERAEPPHLVIEGDAGDGVVGRSAEDSRGHGPVKSPARTGG
ncbi:MAG TPA: hypothetical protein VLL27_04390 [Solirubrobacterales bacterium]|nr:hypothetical protein [Solirubrobacterales bacterium]